MVQGVTDGRYHQGIAGWIQEGFVDAQVMNRLIGVHQAGHDGLFLPGGVHVHVGAAGGDQESHQQGEEG